MLPPTPPTPLFFFLFPSRSLSTSMSRTNWFVVSQILYTFLVPHIHHKCWVMLLLRSVFSLMLFRLTEKQWPQPKHIKVMENKNGKSEPKEYNADSTAMSMCVGRKALRFYLLKSFLLDLREQSLSRFFMFVLVLAIFPSPSFAFCFNFFSSCFYVEWKNVRMAVVIVFLSAECECAATIRYLWIERATHKLSVNGEEPTQRNGNHSNNWR